MGAKLSPKAVLDLAAPHTWAASVMPALFAETYCAWQKKPLKPVQNLELLSACVLMQSAVNAFNDYFDYVSGTDAQGDVLEENDAVLIYGHMTPEQAKLLGGLFLGGGCVLGVLACAHAGPVPYAVGLIGALTVLAYSAGPSPVSHLPVGELVSGFVMGGLIPLGIAGAAFGTAHWMILYDALPMILGVAMIMLTNNGCDIAKDRRAKRNTLPVKLGREKSAKLYRYLTIYWMLLLIVLPVFRLGPAGLLTAVLLLAGAGAPFERMVRSTLDPKDRIAQMKTVTEANKKGGGAYIAAFAAAAAVPAVVKVLKKV